MSQARPLALMMQVSLGASPLRAPPRTFLCYVCGRAYGSASITIHVAACEKKFLAEQAALPLRERKPLPKAIDYSSIAAGGGGQSEEALQRSMEAINEAARAASDQLMAACAFCGRTFNPERLVIHNRSCTAEHPAKRLLSGGGTAGGAGGAGGGGGGSAEEAHAHAPLAPPLPPRSASAGLRRRPSAPLPVLASLGGSSSETAPLRARAPGGGGGGSSSQTAPMAAALSGAAAAARPRSGSSGGGGGGGGGGGAGSRAQQLLQQPPAVARGGSAGPSRAWRSRLTRLAQRLHDTQAAFTLQMEALAGELALLAAEAGEDEGAEE